MKLQELCDLLNAYLDALRDLTAVYYGIMRNTPRQIHDFWEVDLRFEHNGLSWDSSRYISFDITNFGRLIEACPRFFELQDTMILEIREVLDHLIQRAKHFRKKLSAYLLSETL